MKTLSKKTLSKSFNHWFYGNLTCFSQEHMQTFGYMLSMLPVIKELYDTNEERTQKLKTYSTFFNTEPQLGGRGHYDRYGGSPRQRRGRGRRDD